MSKNYLIMRLYIASDVEHKSKDQWFVGFSPKANVDKIKADLGLDKLLTCVDIVVASPQAREIFNIFKTRFGFTSEQEQKKDVILVEGQHNDLAQKLMDISKDYETSHPSLRRSFSKWLSNVESWETMN